MKIKEKLSVSTLEGEKLAEYGEYVEDED